MKILNIKIFVFALLLVFLCAIPLVFCADLNSDDNGSNSIILSERYNLKRTAEPDSYIMGVNIETITDNHLPEFDKKRDNLIWKRGRKWRLLHEENHQVVEITLGVFTTVLQAKLCVLDYFNRISGIPQNGTVSGDIIGDNSWYLKHENVMHGSVTFLRKNVFITVFSSNYYFAEEIAQKIDRDLLGDAQGVKIGTTVEQPKVIGINIASAIIHLNEKVSMQIDAVDLRGQETEFMILRDSGVHILNTDVPEKKILICDEPGTHILSVCAISENNVVSEIKDIEIKCE